VWRRESANKCCGWPKRDQPNEWTHDSERFALVTWKCTRIQTGSLTESRYPLGLHEVKPSGIKFGNKTRLLRSMGMTFPVEISSQAISRSWVRGLLTQSMFLFYSRYNHHGITIVHCHSHSEITLGTASSIVMSYFETVLQ